jgi:hypothetical protein
MAIRGVETRKRLVQSLYAVVREDGSSKLAWRRVMDWARRGAKRGDEGSLDVCGGFFRD